MQNHGTYVFSNTLHSLSGKTLYQSIGITEKEYFEILKRYSVSINLFGMPFFYNRKDAEDALSELKFIEKMVR